MLIAYEVQVCIPLIQPFHSGFVPWGHSNEINRSLVQRVFRGASEYTVHAVPLFYLPSLGIPPLKSRVQNGVYSVIRTDSNSAVSFRWRTVLWTPAALCTALEPAEDTWRSNASSRIWSTWSITWSNAERLIAPAAETGGGRSQWHGLRDSKRIDFVLATDTYTGPSTHCVIVVADGNTGLRLVSKQGVQRVQGWLFQKSVLHFASSAQGHSFASVWTPPSCPIDGCYVGRWLFASAFHVSAQCNYSRKPLRLSLINCWLQHYIAIRMCVCECIVHEMGRWTHVRWTNVTQWRRTANYNWHWRVFCRLFPQSTVDAVQFSVRRLWPIP